MPGFGSSVLYPVRYWDLGHLYWIWVTCTVIWVIFVLGFRPFPLDIILESSSRVLNVGHLYWDLGHLYWDLGHLYWMWDHLYWILFTSFVFGSLVLGSGSLVLNLGHSYWIWVTCTGIWVTCIDPRLGPGSFVQDFILGSRPCILDLGHLY